MVTHGGEFAHTISFIFFIFGPNTLMQCSAIFFFLMQSRMVNILGFVGHMITAVIAPKNSTDNMLLKECGCISIKRYL